MKKFIIIPLLFIAITASSQQLPMLKISDNGHYLQQADGAPFFYQGDTAWELFHRLDREEAEMYLKNRAAKGYNVIQAVALAELDGIGTPNAYGHLPLIDRNPARPAVKEGEQNDYWDHVDYIVKRCNELGMYMGLLPTWGDFQQAECRRVWPMDSRAIQRLQYHLDSRRRPQSQQKRASGCYQSHGQRNTQCR